MNFPSQTNRRPAKTGVLARHALACLMTGALALAWLALPPAAAQDGDPVVARVDGVEIRASDLAIVEDDIGSNLQNMTGDTKREYLITFLSDLIIASKAAEARKMADTADFKRREAYQRRKVLMELLLQAEAKAAATDEALRKVYAEATKQMGDEKEVRARHILVETEDEAKAVLAELKKGGDFAELAKQKSKDPGSADGGDLGYFTKDQMVPQFAEVAFKLEKGQLSEPVKTQFGWHVIRVEDKRDRQLPPFEKVKDQLENYVGRRAQAELVTKLRGEAKIEKLDAKPQAPAGEQRPAGEPKK